MSIIDKVREIYIKREESLAPYACKSSDAIRKAAETKPEFRIVFSKDVDKILHSFAYTRYLDKTQVFSLINDDRVSTRMIHVQLVAKIARTIGRALSLNEDLIEAISLGHDIGHAPFGHKGEAFLNKISLAVGEGYFFHNVQSVREFLVLENNGVGLNISLQTLDGILCHNGEFINEKYEPMYNKTWEQFLNEYNNCYTNDSESKKIRAMTLEGCVVRISDVIAYVGRDIEDAIDLGLLKREELPDNIKEILGDKNNKIVDKLVFDVIENSFGKNYLSLSNSAYNALISLKDFNYKHIYNRALNSNQLEILEKQFNDLFNLYLNDLNAKSNKTDISDLFLKNMADEYINNTSNARKALDYIAGMTDSFFIYQYKKYFKV